MSISIYDDIEQIWSEGTRALDRMSPSRELDIAIGELKDALQQSHHPADMADNIVDVWENNHDALYEQERENFGYNLIDPMLDLLRDAGF